MHLPPHPRAAGLPLLARPEERCRRGSLDVEGLPDLHNGWRSEAFAEDLTDAPADPAAAAPAFLPRALRPRPGRSMAPWFRWSWRALPLQAGR